MIILIKDCLMIRFVAVIAFALWLTSTHWPLSAAEPTRVEISRDAWISAYPIEQQGNNGASHRLKLKGVQEFFLIDFDPRPLRGKAVERAELWVRGEGVEVLDRVTVSTVMADWIEGDGNNYQLQTVGASFLFKSTTQPWHPSDNGDVTCVSLGNAGSRWCFGQASARDADQWQRIPVDPAILQSRIDGKCFGFLVMDDLGSEYTRTGNRFEYHLMPNRFLASREKNRSQAPYFQLWLSDAEPRISETSPTIQPTDDTAHDDLMKLLDELFAATTSTKGDGPELANSQLLNFDQQPIDVRDLCLAKGETVSIVIPLPPEQVQCSATTDLEVTLHALPRVGGKLDPTVPYVLWSQPTWKEGKDSEQVFTCVDIYATKSASPGAQSLTFTLAGRPLPLPLLVWNFQLPDRLSFIPQMNCYGLPEDEIAYFQLCHEHRTTLNRLRYGWSGKVNSEAMPKQGADGNWDWTDWDRRFSSLFDGSAFAKSRRGTIPIEAFYLPLNENWPMDHEKFFRGGYWIEDAYDEAYWTEFRQSAGAFCQHLADRGYVQTLFEFYLNNKVYFKQERGGRWDACSAAWVFDEPVNTQDFWALRRFGIEFWNGTKHISGARLGFRVDISRPQWQRDLLDGVSNIEVVSGSLRRYNQRVIQRAQQYDNLVYMYGSANSFDLPTSTNVAWCVETWLRGGNGVVPWQTIGTADSWAKPDPLSVIYPSESGPIASLRLKSFRAGQQLAEYLESYRRTIGDVNTEQLGNLLLAKLQLEGNTTKTSEADAGSVTFADSSSQRLTDLRYRLGNWLNTHPSFPAQEDVLLPRQGISSNLPEIEPIRLQP